MNFLCSTDLSDPSKPIRRSEVEVAPFVRGIYRVGAHLVEAVSPANPYDHGYSGQPQRTEFRVKKADASNLDEAPVLASFTAGGVSHVMPHGSKLVLFRPTSPYGYWGASLELLVYDLSDPLNPRQAGTATLPLGFHDYWWGWGGFYRSCFSSSSYGTSWVPTASGLAALQTSWNSYGNGHTVTLHFVDLSDPTRPTLSQQTVATSSATSSWGSSVIDAWVHFGLVAAEDEPDLVYVTARKQIGEKTIGDQTIGQFKYYALAFRRQGGGWQAGEQVNVPGLLQQAYSIEGKRIFLTSDRVYEQKQSTSYGNYTYWRSDPRLHLLRRSALGEAVKAALQDTRLFAGWQLADLVRGGSRLFLNALPSYDYSSGGSSTPRRDQLSIFELGGMKLEETFSASTGSYSSQLMRFADPWLFVYLPGDGLLIVDAARANQPAGAAFVPTEDRISHVEVIGQRALLAGGHRGVVEVDLSQGQIQPAL